MVPKPTPPTFIGRLERAMRNAGYNPRSLSLAASLGITAVRDILDGRIGSPRYSTIEALARVLGVTVAYLAEGDEGPPEPPPGADPRNFPIYGSAQGGAAQGATGGAMSVTSEPIELMARPGPLMSVKSSYGVYVVGDSMSPAYNPGDIALVHPSLPPQRGADVILARREVDGTPHALIKQLIGWTDSEWQVRQHNPPRDFTLPRSEWAEVETIIGRYNAR
jgi:hypothetical protein